MNYKVFCLTILAFLSCGSQLRASSIEENEPKDFIYGVIVDCGSSGTRAHIFNWASDLRYPELLNHIEPMRDEKGWPLSKKIYPGLSSMGDDPSKSAEYIEPILKYITSQIPVDKIKQTGIYFMGTAGMRLLEEEIQLQIYKNISDYVESNYDFAKVRTSVISGADEGMYQWITVNSKAKQFDGSLSKANGRTYAVIEMGGASIQVTYQLEPGIHRQLMDTYLHSLEAKRAFASQIVEPQISRNVEKYNYTLVSTTFLGLGSNSAREAYVDLLVSLNRPKYYDKILSFGSSSGKAKKSYSLSRPMSIADPCLPKHGSENFKKPVRMLKAKHKTVGFTAEDDEEAFTVKLLGSGNYNQCKKLLRNLIDQMKFEKMNCKDDEPCTMTLLSTPFVPFDRFNFLGLSELYYTTHEMLNLSGRYKRKNVVRKTKEICETSLNLLSTIYDEADRVDKTRVLRECFKAIWIDIFLTRGIKMPRSYSRLETIRQINGDDLDWTLGAILDKSLAIEEAADPSSDEDGS